MLLIVVRSSLYFVMIVHWLTKLTEVRFWLPHQSHIGLHKLILIYPSTAALLICFIVLERLIVRISLNKIYFVFDDSL